MTRSPGYQTALAVASSPPMYSTTPPKPTGELLPADALELPGVAVREPVVRHFFLPAVMDALLEQAVVVADAIAEGGN